MLSRSRLRLQMPVTYNLLAALFMAVTGMPTQAQSPSPDFAGRWRADKPGLVLDITPCGAGWCGVEVTGNATCGREMLRLLPGAAPAGAWRSRLELAAEAQAYAVEAGLGSALDNSPTLSLDLVTDPCRVWLAVWQHVGRACPRIRRQHHAGQPHHPDRHGCRHRYGELRRRPRLRRPVVQHGAHRQAGDRRTQCRTPALIRGDRLICVGLLAKLRGRPVVHAATAAVQRKRP